jgi:hypothetical protein
MGVKKLCALSAAVAVGFGLFSVNAARADSVFATLSGISPGLPSPLDQVFLAGAGTLNVGVGAIEWNPAPNPDHNPAVNAAPFNAPFTTYCIDLLDNIQPGNSYNFEEASLASAPQNSAFPAFIGGGMGPVKAGEIAELFAQDYALSQLSTNAESAFQLAVWKIVYDNIAVNNLVDPGNGTFFVVGGADVGPATIAIADTYLATLSTTPKATDLEALIGQPVGTVPGGAGSQDQVVINPFSSVVEGPLPSAAWSGSILIGGLGLVTWRKNRLARVLAK